jgi:hypothetical protein
MTSGFNKTMSGLRQVPPQLMPFTVVPFPAYSLDLAPSNFHVFSKLKEDLRG